MEVIEKREGSRPPGLCFWLSRTLPVRANSTMAQNRILRCKRHVDSPSSGMPRLDETWTHTVTKMNRQRLSFLLRRIVDHLTMRWHFIFQQQCVNQQEVKMNKRIRKKQLRRTLCNMVAAYREMEESRKRLLHLAEQELLNAYGKPDPAFPQALKQYLQVVALIPIGELPAYFPVLQR